MQATHTQNAKRTDAHTSTNAPAGDNKGLLGIKMLETLVASIDEPIILLAGEKNTIKWFNRGASDILPTIALGSDLSQVNQALSNAIDVAIAAGITPNTSAGMRRDSNHAVQRFEIDTGIENHKSAHCALNLEGEQHVTVRIPKSRIDSLQLQKYMADRELLFTTSRTISVSEMATTLAHEINQPIGSIANILRGTKSRLEKMGTANDEILLALDKALNQSQFASRIIARIRDFTQSRQPKRVECDVHELLSDSINLLDWVLAQSEVSVKLHSQANAAIVNGDTTMLQQVFTNLIRNAVDAMSGMATKDRHLDIHVRLQERNVQIEIVDKGHGLTQKTQDNLFVPFVTQKTQGMGVGLNICRSFIELHQGRLWLAPNDHSGCTSFVLLPLHHKG
ncbi:MAG: sensor histidine kinase [Granulosicoccaceae bacterium]